MRIIKLGRDENKGGFRNRAAVVRFFDDDLHERKIVGQFGITKAKQEMDDLQRGTLLIFSYAGECMYVGRAASHVKLMNPHSKHYDPDWPAYFVIEMKSLRARSLALATYEKALRAAGLKKGSLVRYRGWAKIPVTFEKLTLRLFRAPIDPGSAVDDLDPPPGNKNPKRKRVASWLYQRDPEVRDYVRQRARGRCEFCKARGFLQPNGHRYLEPHHIIALASEGEDTARNVIALCPNHHREAHYGDNSVRLEKKMIQIVRRKEAKN